MKSTQDSTPNACFARMREGPDRRPAGDFFSRNPGVAVRSPAAGIHWRVGSLRLPTNRRSIVASHGSLVPSLKSLKEEQ